MARSRRTAVRVAGAAIGVAAVGTAVLVVAPGGPGTQVARASGLTPFAGCAELEQWFAGAARQAVGPYGLGGGVGGGVVDMAADLDASAARESGVAAASGLDAGAVGPGGTGTNVQEAGVDEPDVAKSLGDLLVTVDGSRLHVLDVATDQPRELGSLALPSGGASELLLGDDRALVLGTSWHEPVPVPGVPEPAPGAPQPKPVEPAPVGTAEPMPVEPVAPDAPAIEPVPADGAAATGLVAPDMRIAGWPTAVLTVVDLSDPESPSVVRVDEVEGAYVSARERDGIARVVLHTGPSLPFVMAQTMEEETQATERNAQVAEDATAQDWLPQRVRRDAAGTVVGTEPLLECGDVSHPTDPSGIGVTTVLTLPLSGADDPTSVAVAADGDLVYASPDRLYVATTRGGWARPAAQTGLGPLETSGSTLQTHLHAFDVTGPVTSYVASGAVEGWLLGRWAMSEYEGRLRVVTTRGEPWSGGDEPGTDSAVTVLEERGRDLTAVGSVDGLGRGEQVRAVRWFGDIATVVTFRQTDPLYTVDLSDPTAPRVVGELKVPGYSAYLHPLGDGLLLGVGQDATAEGRTLGTQVATYDLRDLAAPTQLDVLVEPESWSDVEADSRAFSYLPELRTAFLSLSTGSGSALWAVRIDADGAVAESGRLRMELEEWLARALPVGGDRLAVVVDDAAGRTVTLVSASALTELGSARLG